MSTVSDLYARAQDIAAGTIDLEVSWGTVFYLTIHAVVTLFITAMVLDIFSRCTSLKDDVTQQRFDKYLDVSTIAGFAIPFALAITKFVNGEARVFTMIYAFMGVVSGAIIMNWTQKCNDVRPSEERYARVSVGIAMFLMLFAILFLG